RAHALPTAGDHLLTTGHSEGTTLRLISEQIDDVPAHGSEVLWSVEPPGLRALDEVEGAAAGRSDDGNLRGHRLLDRLAEGFELARDDHETEARDCLRQSVAAEETGEVRCRQCSGQTGPPGSVADDDQTRTGHIGENREVLDLLLSSQPAGEPDDLLP